MVRHQLAAAAVAHFDETGGGGVAAALDPLDLRPRAYLAERAPQAGKQAMDAAGVLPAFQCVAFYDGWSPYWSYDAAHALCRAHLLRELDAVACEPR